ncbi:MAG: 4a-hydroxytetrahydrobiopterin dehydratase [Candidatus Omnitrophota bacterium]
MSNTTDFSAKKCVPCEGIGRCLTRQEVLEFLENCPHWSLSGDDKSIERLYVYRNFVQVVDMINRIKDIAQEEGHHPDLHLTGFKNLRVVLYTHALGGITENDLIVASKINKLG